MKNNIVGPNSWINRITKIFQSPFWIAVMFFFVIFLNFTPIYDGVDDANMARMVSGNYGVESSPLLVFINPVYGQILTKLYGLYPGIGWYGILFLVVLFVAFYFNLKIIYKVTIGSWLVRIISILFVVPFYFYGIVFLQFTYVSSVAACVGTLVLCSQMMNKNNVIWRPILIGGGLILFSLIVRENTFYYVFVLSLPLMVLSYFRSENKRNVFPILKSFLIVFGLFVCAKIYSDHLYSYSPKWNEYMKWTAAKAYFHSYSVNSYENNPEVYRRIGWSENDYLMLDNWFYLDNQLFSSEKITKITSEMRSLNVSREGFGRTAKIFVDQFRYHPLVFLGLLYFLASVLVLVLCQQKEQRSYLFFTTVTIVFGLGLLAYFSFLGRIVPERFVYPFILTIGLNVFLSGLPIKDVYPKIKLTGLLLFSGLISLFFLFVVIYRAGENGEKVQRFSEIISKIPNNALVFNWGSALPMHWVSVFDPLTRYKKLDVIGTGWPQRSPYDLAIIDKYGIRDLYVEMIDNPNVYLVAPIDYSELLMKYMDEHYNKKIAVEIVEDFTKYEFSPRYGYGASLIRVKSD